MEIPKGGLLGKIRGIWYRVQEMSIPTHAANAGYFIVLSVFPWLVLILSLLRYTALDVQDLLSLLDGVLPAALMGAAEDLIISTFAHTSTAVVSISAVSALWSASRGIYSLLRGLNAVYGVEEKRGYWYTRGICMVYTFLFLVMLLLTLVLNVFGEGLLQLLPPARGGFGAFLADVIDLRGLLLLVLLTLLFAVVFMYLPGKNNRFWDSLPGAVLASVGWLVFTQLFSVYVEHFAGYTNLYGSVYAVALSMLWLYCCLSIVFYGGALNKLLQEETL